ncbi:MAG: pre-tRNA nuclear export protein [Cirrosporium novae-zelandiae]|nr:MAG: pre-tRNA nuclear export protein [Cirrosporium novae-zelandiae]
MEEEVTNAIRVAWDPTSDQRLKAAAYEYLTGLRSNPSAWQVCLSLFTRDPPLDDVVRHVGLELVNNTIRSGYLDQQGLATVKENLWQYILNIYGPQGDKSKVDTPAMQNKLTQAMTFLFSVLYAAGWESFFSDFLGLTNIPKNGDMEGHAPGVALYLRILNSVHEEIADQIILRSEEEKSKANELKDLVRVRDMRRIILSWQEILTQWRGKDYSIIEMCLRTIGRWVSWVDISLLVDQTFLSLLYDQVSRTQQQSLGQAEEKVRDATVDTFAEIVGKGMQPGDKIDLIVFLNLDQVISQLITSPALSELRFSSKYDTDFAETVAKLVNITSVDIIKSLEAASLSAEARIRAEELLRAFMQHILRFFSDEYDEVCSTVIPALSDVLGFFRKYAKAHGSLPEQYSRSLGPILGAIVTKVKYDETSSWGEEDDQTDEAEFQELRKRLNNLQQIIFAIDEPMYLEFISNVVGRIFQALEQSGDQLDWRELELGLYEMYQLGDLAVKSGGLYSKKRPVSPAAERLAAMLAKLAESNISGFRHPATQVLYMEICVRYSSFFEMNPSMIPRVLESLLQLVHSPSPKVKLRSWYLLLRFLRQMRFHIGDVAESVIGALQPLLPIMAELSGDNEENDMSSDDVTSENSADTIFVGQLNLFEAIGCISATSAVPVDKQALIAQTIMNPIFSDMESQLPSAKGGDERAALQVHHDIMALGTLAKGYSEWSPGSTSGSPPAQEVSIEFTRVGDATLTALETLNESFQIRTASRFAFSRLIGVIGRNILPQLSRWIDGLVTQSSTKDEMALFLRLMEQVIHGFKGEISDILDTLLTPFMQRVFNGIAEPPAGTDDEIQSAELKREYLNFLLVILNNDLGSILISPRNQGAFETVISMLELFAKDSNDFPTSKMAFLVLSKMATTWGGTDPAKHALPGFDQFMMTRFSPLCWAAAASFNPKDAQAKQALNEAAGLQKTIYSVCGDSYFSWLRETELRSMGMNDDLAGEYLKALMTLDSKGFKHFFQVRL